MKPQNSLPWVLGAGLLALLMGAGGWLLGISPLLEETSTMNAQTDQELVRAQQLETQLTQLKADFAKIDEYRADLANLKVKIPAELTVEATNSEIATLADQAGVFVDSQSLSAPVAVAPAVEAAPAATDGTGTTAEAPAEGTSTDATASEPAAPASSGLFAVPIQVTVVGSFDKSMAFLDLVQTKSNRLYLVSNVAMTQLSAEGARGLRPAIADGDVSTVLTLWYFVLPAASTDGAPAAETPALPVPSGQPNPFATT